MIKVINFIDILIILALTLIPIARVRFFSPQKQKHQALARNVDPGMNVDAGA
jgi:hypothetical protein